MAGENPQSELESSRKANIEGSNPLPPKPNVSKAKKNTNGGKKRSWVWEHFTELINENSDAKRRATCNYCPHSYACDPKQNGTTSLSNHLENQCPSYPFRKVDKGQTTLGFKPKMEGDPSSGLVPVIFNLEKCRLALAEMLIVDELPFRFVEGDGFRKFMLTCQPKWTRIPSRVTMARDGFKVYLREKKSLKNALKGQRVCLTTDTWTSLQNLNYMCLTAHFIDSDWKLHKRILNFCVVESHKGSTLGMQIEMCLLDWGIDKILTLTVDNASSNTKMIDFIKRKTKNRKGTILQHEFLHMRCSAHILNLVVRDGLKEMDASIVRVRNAVRYVRSSPQRLKIFKLCAEKEKLPYKFQVVLDVPTRWNYTYVMLDRAEKYQKAFERLDEEDPAFLDATRVESDGLGPPTSEDWDKCRLFVKFLKLFYDATLRFSGTNHITSNAFFMELVTIQDTIQSECREGDLFLQSMADNMKLKFDKYWGNIGDINQLLYVAMILDPRWKLRYIEFCFGLVDSLTKNLAYVAKNVLTRLYEAYVANEGECSGQAPKSQSKEGSSSGLEASKDMRALRMSEFKKHLQVADSMENKSELEKYLMESCEEDVEGFDVLAWWKGNSGRYRVLSLVARHVLAIPVSTVASESAFSTGGRVLDSFRSSLSPKMAEALICAQNWLHSSSNPISLLDAIVDVDDFEKLEAEFMEEATPLEVEPTIIED